MVEYPREQQRKHSETIYSEVIPMDAKARILAIHLMETLRKDPVYAQSLGVEVDLKKRLV